MKTGSDLLALAETRLGEKYVNIVVPKDNKNWHGPWDCAEFASWTVYQVVGKLYGCTNNADKPSVADAYSGAWVRDARNNTIKASSVEEALNTAGVILIRKPPAPGRMGHVAISDGFGKTVEAAGSKLGVIRGKVQGRVWDYVAKIPELTYTTTSHTESRVAAPYVLRLEETNVKSALVKKVQQALKAAGFDPGKIDSEYGPHTLAAVVAFQSSQKLVADGVVGPATAKKLAVEWPTS